MNNIITNFDTFLNEGFLGIKKDREYDPEDYMKYLEFKKYINIIMKNPKYAIVFKPKNSENLGIKFKSNLPNISNFEIINSESGVFVNGIFDDRNIYNRKIDRLYNAVNIEKFNGLYNKALKLLHSAIQTVKNDFEEIKYR